MFLTDPRALFLILFNSRKNNLFEFVSEHQLDCPGELLAKARGEILFKDENTMVRRALPQGELGVPPTPSPQPPGRWGLLVFWRHCIPLERQAVQDATKGPVLSWILHIWSSLLSLFLFPPCFAPPSFARTLRPSSYTRYYSRPWGRNKIESCPEISHSVRGR